MVGILLFFFGEDICFYYCGGALGGCCLVLTGRISSGCWQRSFCSTELTKQELYASAKWWGVKDSWL